MVLRDFLTMHGGPAFVEACKVHINVPVGDIVCTTSGDLQCRYVIHAVSCDWDKTNKTREVRQWLQTNNVYRLSFLHSENKKIIKDLIDNSGTGLIWDTGLISGTGTKRVCLKTTQCSKAKHIIKYMIRALFVVISVIYTSAYSKSLQLFSV